MSKILNENRGSLIRSVIRAGVVLVTAFGLDLTPEQIGAIQLAAEAVLQAAVRWDARA